MIRRPLRPLARILRARAEGKDPDLVEAEERAARLAARHRTERAKAETRLLLLGVVFILGFSTVAGRMALVSAGVPVEPQGGLPGDPIHTRRADIVDRNGVVLATNIVTASLYAQPVEMIDPQTASVELAKIFPDLDAQELYAKLIDGRKFIWIERTISPEQRQRVHDLGEPGLLFGPRETRLYPERRAGGARARRRQLRARGRACRRGDRHRRGGAGVRRAPARSRRGRAAAAALDRRARCRRRSRTCWPRGSTEMRAKGAVGILMEAGTGQIRALASLPDFDPNLRPPLPTQGDPADSPLFNRAAQGRYELGSVFKPFTVATAIEAGLIGPQTLVDSKSPMRYGRFTIRDFHDYGARLTVEDVLVKSSNIGAAHIGMMLGSGAAAGVLQEGRASRRFAGRAVRGGEDGAAAAGALDRPFDRDDLLRPRHGGDAAASRRGLRRR